MRRVHRYEMGNCEHRRQFASRWMRKVTGLGKLESAHGVAIERRHAGAGIPTIVPRLEMDDERWQVQIDTNLTGSADDVAPLVTFIASDAAHMISGATFDVTGGDSARKLA